LHAPAKKPIHALIASMDSGLSGSPSYRVRVNSFTYASANVARTSEMGGTNLGAMSLRRRIAWMSARPVRPLPSTKGWIVSNCACAMAACATAGSMSLLQNLKKRGR